jgi:protein-S-isoprenylcysteine O-methyltransferase Ste14
MQLGYKAVHMRDTDRIWYKLRGILVAPLYLLSLFCVYWEVEHWSVKIIGLAVFIIGLFLRIWSQMHLRYRLKGSRTLTITGPYVFVRNPIYIGTIMILVGTVLISESVWLAPIMFFATVITYTQTIKYEEKHLTKIYGSPYVVYQKRVPRWIPDLIYYKETSIAIHNEWEFLLPSIRAEVHIPLLLILPIMKDLWMSL